jgi:hypothetical protein
MGGSNGMMDGGNVITAQPYFIAGKTGALTVPAAGAAIATLQHLGRIDPIDGALKPSPIKVSTIRMHFGVTSGATLTTSFEVFKVAVTTQHTVGGTQVLAGNRKTTGYPAITAAETNLFIATTAAISGGTTVAESGSLDMVGVGQAATFGFGASYWLPTDMCPVTLEIGQGLEVRVVQQGGAAVGIFHISVDFLR